MVELDATGRRWVVCLANYNFKISYRSGKQNVDADALSRIPWETEQVSATLEHGLCGISHMPTKSLINMMTLKPEVLPKLTNKDWINKQSTDPDFCKKVELIKWKEHLKYKCAGSNSDELKLLMRFHKDLILKDGLLYQKTQLKGHNKPIKQFVMPKAFRLRMIQSMHS